MFLLAQIGVVVMVFIQLMIPQLVQQIIDDGIVAGDTDHVINVGFQMILWSVLNLVVASGVAYLAAVAATNLAHGLRRILYEKVTTFSHGDLDRLSTAELLVRLTSDVNIMKTAFMQTMYMLFQAPWMLVGAVFLVFGILYMFDPSGRMAAVGLEASSDQGMATIRAFIGGGMLTFGILLIMHTVVHQETGALRFSILFLLLSIVGRIVSLIAEGSGDDAIRNFVPVGLMLIVSIISLWLFLQSEPERS